MLSSWKRSLVQDGNIKQRRGKGWNPYSALNTNYAQGRRLYSLAIEMRLQLVQSPALRVSSLLEYLKKSYSHNTKKSSGLHNILKTIEENFKNLVKEFKQEQDYKINISKKVSIIDRNIHQQKMEQSLEKLINLFPKGGEGDQLLVELFFGKNTKSPFADAAAIRNYIKPNCWKSQYLAAEDDDKAGFPYIERFNLGCENKKPEICFHMVFRTSDTNNINLGHENPFKYATSSLDLAATNDKKLFNTDPKDRLKKINGQGVGQCREFSIPTLGRYNNIVMRLDEKPLCRCHLPRWDKSPPFFTRREVWISTHVKGQDRDKQNFASGTVELDPMAFLYVRLHHHQERLDFLHWINEAIARLEIVDDEIKAADTKKMRLFLTDGWADLVLMFGRGFITTSDDSSELLKLYELRNHIFDHFMVSRTELSPTTMCIESASAQPDKFMLTIKIRINNRLRDERDVSSILERDILASIKSQRDECKKKAKASTDPEKKSDLIRCAESIDSLQNGILNDINGQMDLSIIYPNFPSQLKFGDLQKVFDETKVRSHIDKIEILIGNRHTWDGASRGPGTHKPSKEK
ncbi:MAG: hypothetical protein HQL69_20900 [Magnetococcales bacterium]|nr:hypothetical protein [Magnetococcales bacterium]